MEFFSVEKRFRKDGLPKKDSITILTKIMIIKDCESGMSREEIRLKYNLKSVNNISRIMINKQKFLEAYEKCDLSPMRKTLKKTKYEQIDQGLVQFIRKFNKRGVALSDGLIKAKGLDLVRASGQCGLKVSSGYVEKLKKRHGINGSLNSRFRMRSKQASSCVEQQIQGLDNNNNEILSDSAHFMDEPEDVTDTFLDDQASIHNSEFNDNNTFTNTEIVPEIHNQIDPIVCPSSGHSSCSSEIKRTRTDWSNEQKREIIVFHEANPHYTQQRLANHFTDVFKKRIGRSTINDILKSKSRFFSGQCNSSFNEDKRQEELKNPILEKMLYDWATELLKNGVSISDKMLIQLAKKFGEQIGIKSNFKYSNGWLQRFKQRYDLLETMTNVNTSNIRYILNEHDSKQMLQETQLNNHDFVSDFVNKVRAAQMQQEQEEEDTNSFNLNETTYTHDNSDIYQYEQLISPVEFKESIRKVELFLRQSDFLFDSDDIQLFSKFKSRLDLIQ